MAEVAVSIAAYKLNRGKLKANELYNLGNLAR
jgi:hypothetical protein